MVHGDIKPENILVTSFNQVYLTDLVCYKPSYIRSDVLQEFNYYFGELDNNKRCYVAPERFREQFADNLEHYDNLQKPMDVFSLGCVIAEIFMEGAVLFDRAKLFSYRRGEYDPRQDLTNRIADGDVVQLIMRMLDLDPASRPDIN